MRWSTRDLLFYKPGDNHQEPALFHFLKECLRGHLELIIKDTSKDRRIRIDSNSHGYQTENLPSNKTESQGVLDSSIHLLPSF